jgi:hypothetical protein
MTKRTDMPLAHGTLDPVEAFAKEIVERSAAQAAQIDAVDDHVTEDHLAAVIAVGATDVSHEAISAQTPPPEPM